MVVHGLEVSEMYLSVVAIKRQILFALTSTNSISVSLHHISWLLRKKFATRNIIRLNQDFQVPCKLIHAKWFQVCFLGKSDNGLLIQERLFRSRFITGTEESFPWESGFVGSSGAPWSKRSRINDPFSDFPKETHSEAREIIPVSES